MPLGTSGLKLNLDYTGNKNEVVSGDLKNLGIEGDAKAYSVGLRYPLVVTDSSRCELGLTGWQESRQCKIAVQYQ